MPAIRSSWNDGSCSSVTSSFKAKPVSGLVLKKSLSIISLIKNIFFIRYSDHIGNKEIPLNSMHFVEQTGRRLVVIKPASQFIISRSLKCLDCSRRATNVDILRSSWSLTRIFVLSVVLLQTRRVMNPTIFVTFTRSKLMWCVTS